ncbi:hypothetical protein U1Q18_035146 [Sarracenia purpurea var. burkii]
MAAKVANPFTTCSKDIRSPTQSELRSSEASHTNTNPRFMFDSVVRFTEKPESSSCLLLHPYYLLPPLQPLCRCQRLGSSGGIWGWSSLAPFSPKASPELSFTQPLTCLLR